MGTFHLENITEKYYEHKTLVWLIRLEFFGFYPEFSSFGSDSSQRINAYSNSDQGSGSSQVDPIQFDLKLKKIIKNYDFLVL